MEVVIDDQEDLSIDQSIYLWIINTLAESSILDIMPH